jgi:4,4'-diaponeurosporenoate glycosyltransferase
MDLVLLALAATFFSAGFLFLFRIPLCRDDHAGDGSTRSITVIVPARNEARNLPRLLGSLNAQELRPDEIIVVDDQSEDETAAVAIRYGASVLSSRPLPDGWVGKAWACWQGAQAAAGDMLVFLDADVWLTDGALKRMMHSYARNPGAMSIAPFHEVQKSYEQLSAFFNIIMMGSMNAFGVSGAASVPTGLFGPALIVSRDRYFAVDGHRAVKNRILENFFMAQLFTARGIPLVCFGGKGTLSFRMYPHGIAELFHGWSKAFATGAGNTARIPLLTIVAWLSGMIITCISVGTGYAVFGLPFLTISLALYLAYAAQLHWMLRRIGSFALYTSLLFPVPLFFFIAIFAHSAIITSRGGVRWKDRTVHT